VAARAVTWPVGARPLPLRPDGFGTVLPTPAELIDRRLPTIDRLPPPVSATYESTSVPVPPEVLTRSTWTAGCPVRRERLRYLTMSFWGFDDRPHTGEMLVRVDVAQDVVDVFGQLFEARYPIEEMRVVALPELTLPPTGDGNNTTGFVCRRARGQTRFSAHAQGLAIDVNPFHNPFQRGGLVLPELASAYRDRNTVRPGMITDADIVVRTFGSIGWAWGGWWSMPLDPMHFSATGD
jgi:hypothetical protein